MREVLKQLDLLRQLEELDLMLKDINSPQYKKFGFKSVKPSLEFIKSTEERRAKLKRLIDPKIIVEYERIIKRYGGRVVVQVINEFCGGCYVKLPAEYVGRCKVELLNCPHCARFLYWIK